MILLIGQVGREFAGRESFQEVDYRAFFGPITKWATEIDDPARVPEIVSRAFHTAANGRPGPVVVGIPEDMLVERVAVADAPPYAAIETSPGGTEMAKLAQLLAGARAPIFLLGGSRWSQAASDDIGRFAQKYGLPVATTFRRGHLFDMLHPCYAGDLGIGPNPKLIERIKASDLVILVGGRLGELPSQSYTLFDIPRPQVPFVHVRPLVGMGGDKLMAMLTPALNDQEGVGKQIAQRRKQIFLSRYVAVLQPAPGARELTAATASAAASGLATAPAWAVGSAASP